MVNDMFVLTVQSPIAFDFSYDCHDYHRNDKKVSEWEKKKKAQLSHLLYMTKFKDVNFCSFSAWNLSFLRKSIFMRLESEVVSTQKWGWSTMSNFFFLSFTDIKRFSSLRCNRDCVMKTTTFHWNHSQWRTATRNKKVEWNDMKRKEETTNCVSCAT